MIEGNSSFDDKDGQSSLDLMKEYTSKLNDANQFLQNRLAAPIVITFLVSLLAILVIMYFAIEYPKGDPFGLINPHLLGLATGLMLSVGLLSIIALRSLNDGRFHRAEQIANILRKLIGYASQYREHAPRRFSKIFEFDLRIVEAESALRSFERSANSLLVKILFGNRYNIP